ncbi:MAG: diaminobutyrate acetyltransferase [Alphaproteobacteria bacterium]|nr:diaminobutyrate acetyltransferase [Alphaproteobacteria bacterium]
MELPTSGPDIPAAPNGALFQLRAPTKEDGQAVWELVAACPPLDQNSMYCNILQCTHFAETCVLAERGGKPLGWLSAHCPPADPRTLFVWQIAVHNKARGKGLGQALLDHLLARPNLAAITHVKATITPDNRASWSLFESLARRLGAPLAREDWLECDRHFGGRHAAETLITIGPLETARTP